MNRKKKRVLSNLVVSILLVTWSYGYYLLYTSFTKLHSQNAGTLLTWRREIRYIVIKILLREKVDPIVTLGYHQFIVTHNVT